MNSATGAPELEAITRFWGHAYTLSHDPGTCPGKPYAARRNDGKGTIRAATPAHLLDAIKDDAAARPFTPDPA
ncbi:MAG: hypothetical protein ACRDRJ_36945 [Streptosporangiaceae bacterium]